MKRGLAALVAIAAMMAIPAGAQGATVNRIVETMCDRNVVLTFKTIDGTPRYTEVGCPNWTFFSWDKMTYVTWKRPQTDLEAAGRSARAWWPKCAIGFPYQSSSTVDSAGRTRWFWWFRVCV